MTLGLVALVSIAWAASAYLIWGALREVRDMDFLAALRKAAAMKAVSRSSCALNADLPTHKQQFKLSALVTNRAAFEPAATAASTAAALGMGGGGGPWHSL
jgi:hypothetical protein